MSSPHRRVSAYVLPSFRRSDKWGSITVCHEGLLDAGSIWSVTFDEYLRVAPAGGAPLFNISQDRTINGVATAERVAQAASPAVHRVIVAALSTLASTGSFELSLQGVVTRPISVGTTAPSLQTVRGMWQ